jgi:hypothetical protein
MSADLNGPTSSRYVFEGGYPTAETIEQAYDDADLTRAIQAYKFFYPTVEGLSIVKGSLSAGLSLNRVYGTMDTKPEQVGFTANSDTPYAPIMLDLRAGPMVIEVPAEPVIGVAMDVNQRWLGDMGLPGPDAGKGGKHLLLPPGWEGEVPQGYFPLRSTTYRVIIVIRSVPFGGDLDKAMRLLPTVQIWPLEHVEGWIEPRWIEMNEPLDMTPLAWETNLEYWRELHEVIDTEPPIDEWRVMYGDLAALGIAKGEPFAPDERMTRILEEAALIANGQLRVKSLADRRPDRIAWEDSRWEWAALRQNPAFAADAYVDVDAREKWFFQAVGVSPVMMRRDVRGRSVYWLGTRDASGAYLDGGKSYRLRVPQPVPARLFWSVTVYDAETRSEIQTNQNKAALRSLFELANLDQDAPVELSFGPDAPAEGEGRWIKTIPDKGWFVYFRIYGPEQPAFDGSWRLPDFEQVG